MSLPAKRRRAGARAPPSSCWSSMTGSALIRRGMRVVDLGAAPGGWTQVALAARRRRGGGHRSAGDRTDPRRAPARRRHSATTDMPARLTEMLGGGADLVLSDMAPNTTGHTQRPTISESWRWRNSRCTSRKTCWHGEWQLCRKSVSGRQREAVAGSPEAGILPGEACQAAGQSEGI